MHDPTNYIAKMAKREGSANIKRRRMWQATFELAQEGFRDPVLFFTGGPKVTQEEQMLFVTIGKAKATSTTKQRVARRIDWKYPTGVKIVGEYWLQSSDPTLIVISDNENVGSLMRAISDWDDVLEFTVLPAVTAEEGLQLAKQMAAS